tara:strand:+ start:1465 stop:1683 length:219 start_codon:yes stop_codon:yes gene_type:complete
MLDSSIYFVATHYKISIADVNAMSPEVFEQSFVWASAAKQIEGEEMENATKDMKSGSDVASSKGADEAFPYE